KPKKSEKVRAIWNTTTREILIDTLGAQKAEGNQTDNASWKSDAWTACAEALTGTEKGPNGSGGPPKTAKMCGTRWVAEKQEYLQVKSLRNLSGAGWDAENNLVVMEDAVWEAILKSNPKLKKWCTKSFPLYDELSDLVDGGVANRDNSFVPGQQGPLRPDDSHEDDDQEFPLDPQLRGEGGAFRGSSPEVPIPGWERSEKGDSDNENPEEIEPPKTVRKRTRAMSDSPEDSVSGKRRRSDGHGRKPSAGHAMFAVSESLKEVALALGRDPGGPSSPQRKTKAITVIKKLTIADDDKVRALQLIHHDTSFADVLLALDEDDPFREAFVLAEIRAARRAATD
ncbi:hypothetical protein DFH07DRAFT_1029627, partial [Mycena maculata]